MKFNKAKLAALATSVFMGVAMLASAAFASEEEEVKIDPHVGPKQEEQQSDKDVKSAKVIGVIFHENDMKVDFVLGDENNEQIDILKNQGTATYEVAQEATCTLPELSYKVITVDPIGKQYSQDKFETKKALNHPEANRVYKEELWSDKEVGPADHIENSDYHVTGKIRKGYFCTLCNQWIEGKYEDFDHEIAHNWVVNKYIIPESQKEWVKLGDDGMPTLIDPTHGGVYDIEYICTIGEETETYFDRNGEYVELKPTQGTALVPKFYDIKNIKSYYDNYTEYPVAAAGSELLFTGYEDFNYDDEKIVLIDCAKPGYYTVIYSAEWTPVDKTTGAELPAEEFYYDANGKLVQNLTEAVATKVAPHHVYSGKVRIARENGDMNKKAVGINLSYKYYDKDGNEVANEEDAYSIKFFNNNCKDSDTYRLDYECLGGNGTHSWVTGTTQTVEPNPDAHKIPDGYVAAKVAQLEKDPSLLNVAKELYGYGKDHKGRWDTEKSVFVGLENVTENCVEKNSGEMAWYCTVCGKELFRVKIELPALGHKKVQVRENIVPATCDKDGSYEAVEYCDRCKEELNRRTVIIPKTGKHTLGDEYISWIGNVVVDYNGQIKAKDTHKLLSKVTPGRTSGENAEPDYKFVGTPAGTQTNATYAQDYFVVGATVKDCEVCDYQETVGYADLTVISVEKSTKNGYPGVITIKAEYKDADGKVLATDTKAFDYYTSINEYQSRVEKAPEEDPTPVDPEQPEVPEQLPAVENLKAATTGMNKITLTWDAVEGANGYLILKNGTQIAYTTGATTYTDKNASSENFEFYWVIPFQKVDGKNYKGQLSNYVWGIGRVVGQVQKVTATGAEGAVELSWNAVSGANGYVILSKTGSNTAPFNAAVETTETSATVKAEAGAVQFYWVYATYTNADGNKVAAGKCSPFAWAIAE